MRFLIDQPVSPKLADWLRTKGHQAEHVRERGLSRATDEAIFALAELENSVIITSDLDFSRILALSGRSHPGLILFRAGSITDDEMLLLIQRVIAKVSEDKIQHSVVIVEQTRLRVARLPVRPDLGKTE